MRRRQRARVLVADGYNERRRKLLGVIGHEIGHVAPKDSKKAFKQALLTSALLDAAAGTNKTAAALTDSQLGKLGEALAGATYSKKQETAADDYGYDFLKKPRQRTGGDGQVVHEAQKELQGDAKSSKLNQLFSSHPDLDARIKRMQKRATDDGYQL